MNGWAEGLIQSSIPFLQFGYETSESLSAPLTQVIVLHYLVQEAYFHVCQCLYRSGGPKLYPLAPVTLHLNYFAACH